MTEIQKVTDPAKMVTDPLVLDALVEQGIDKDFVEFSQDYAPRSLGKERSPYAKFYRDLKSGKRIMVVSGLPMVNHDGIKVSVGWEKIGNTYHAKPNQFSVQVTRSRVLLRCINDQPGGEKKNDQVEWEPQLFLDGVEQTCGKAVLLESDPKNENYHQNVLEWDYGVCKRRIRIIEGRFRERWLFESNPHGDIRIKHNFNGSLELKLGYSQDAEGKELQVRVTDDEEVVEASEFDKAIYPVEIGASMTFYPDAHPETSTVDGFAGRQSIEETWANKISLAGNYSDDDSWQMIPVFMQTTGTQDQWWYNRRGIVLFDATGLPANAEIDLAELDLRGRDAVDGPHKSDTLGVTPDINIYASTPASNIGLVPADYQELGSVPFCDTPKTYAAWSLGYNVFALNAAGIAAISKTLMSKFGAQNANYDVAENPPAWSASKLAYLVCYSAEKGNGYKPKLIVTYHLLIEGSANGEGIGIASTQGLLDVIGQPSGSGIGQTSVAAYLDVLAQAEASGIGLALTSPYLIIPATASGQGIGLFTAQAILDVLAQAEGSGVGLGSTEALIRILAAVAASGEGLGLAEALLEVIAEAAGEGIGLGVGTGTPIKEGQADGSGIGSGTLAALLKVLAEAQGSGIGLGATVPYLIIPASAIGFGVGEGLLRLKIEGFASGSGIGIASVLALAFNIKSIPITIHGYSKELDFTTPSRHLIVTGPKKDIIV